MQDTTRRFSERNPIEVTVNLETQDGEVHEFVSRDLSFGGMLIEGAVKLDLASPCRLSWKDPEDGEQHFVGWVVHATEHGKKIRHGVCFGRPMSPGFRWN